MARLSHLRALLLSGVASLALVRAAPVDANPRPGWWRDATFYEIFVRSFADSTTGPLANDGIGDLQGLIDHLDYLNDGRGAEGRSLGINAVWLMPVQPSPSYHGYDVTDYFAVNPQYGDVALMKRFVAEAHRRGIRVIVDFVLNHCSSQHPLFRAAVSGRSDAATLAARRQFRFADLPEQLSGPWGQRVWHPVREEFFYGVFSSEMPDWNFRDPAVTDHHRRAAEFWLREVGVDGFRLDAVRYFYESDDELQDTEETRRWLADFTAFCHGIKPGAFVIGENTADMKEIARGIRGQSLDSGFEFDLEKATLEALRLQTPGILGQALTELGDLYHGDSPWATILTNHDQERVATQLGGDLPRTRFATQLLFTLPGVPFVYYGEELGMSGAKPDPELRTPMPWTADRPNGGFSAPTVKPWHELTANPSQINVASEEANPSSMLNLYRRLIRLNAASPALRHGTAARVTQPDRHTYAVVRQSDTDAVLVLANFTTATRACPLLSIDGLHVDADWPLREELHAADVRPPQIGTNGNIGGWRPLNELAPNTVYVLHWTKR